MIPIGQGMHLSYGRLPPLPPHRPRDGNAPGVVGEGGDDRPSGAEIGVSVFSRQAAQGYP